MVVDREELKIEEATPAEAVSPSKHIPPTSADGTYQTPALEPPPTALVVVESDPAVDRMEADLEQPRIEGMIPTEAVSPS